MVSLYQSHRSSELFPGDCVLEAGCHPLVTKDSVLYYPEALEPRPTLLDDKIARGKFERKQNMEGALLRKVINACRQTKHLPGKYRHYVHQA